MPNDDRAEQALAFLVNYGQVEGAHHKAWVIDQVVSILVARDPDAYAEFVKMARDGQDGPETYDWDRGIAP